MKKTYTIQIDSKLEPILDKLKDDLGKTSRAEVFRLGIALLKLVTEGTQDGQKLILTKGDDRREILIPG